MKRIIGFIVVTAIIWGCTNKSKELYPEIEGSYLGLKSPGDIPEIFAPGIVSKAYDERMIFFTQDGGECYFQLRGVPRAVILNMRMVKSRWTNPEVAFFSGRYFEEFSLSQDGNIIVFASNRPINGNDQPSADFYVWKIVKKDGNWTEPQWLGSVFKGAGYPTISNNGNIYFFDDRVDGYGKGDVYVSTLKDGKYQRAINLGDSINTKGYEVDPFIAPDESYIIYASHLKKGGLYISYKRNDKLWTKGIYMGDEIGKGESICPSVSPDGKYLFFTSMRNVYKDYNKKVTYNDKLNMLNGPGNGNNDIYWVNADVINKLKPKYIE